MNTTAPENTTMPTRLGLNLKKSSWTRVRFGEVVDNANRKSKDTASEGAERIIAMEHLDPGEITVQRFGTLEKGTTFTRHVKPGQTLFGKRRAYQRKAAFADVEAVCSGDILTFEAVDGRILPEFLPFVVQSDGFYEHALGTSAGSLSPRTNWRDLKDYEFDLPPLDEQQRLANLLWTLERHRTSLTDLGKQGESLRAVHVDELVAGIAGPRVNLGDVLEVFRGGSPRPINDYFTDDDDGLNWIKIGDVPHDGKFIEKTSQKIKPEGLTKTRQVKPGDFLLSNSMSFGRPYITRIPGCIHDGWLALQDQADVWRTEYLYYLLRSRVVQQQFQQAAGGSTVKNLNKDIVKRVKVTHPTLQEQDAALAVIAAHTRSIRRVQHQGSLLNALRSALVAEIFEEEF